MKKMLHSIRKKVDDIGVGLLRFRESDKQFTLQVNTKFNDESLIHCFVYSKMDLKLVQESMVNIVQKQKDDYLYLAGQAENISKAPGGRIVSVRIFKASWFVKCSRGTMSWLEEKHVYDISGSGPLQMVS